jgi:hypothetical protein
MENLTVTVTFRTNKVTVLEAKWEVVTRAQEGVVMVFHDNSPQRVLAVYPIDAIQSIVVEPST